ncbi:energy transducer TonB [Colwellia sp. BRX8-7]|jgi:protein TonB|uniref:energy transducer TonB n=1 Tax=Colwellia sp. BRX8-7 TaxID=2759833 RepID=UPI0015F3F62C|nr:energy transducer TonB [Colwellia sp. BRX8-7]MBA6339268.1 energy transducer TonB [Colwellia sp. BRX8-7]
MRNAVSITIISLFLGACASNDTFQVVDESLIEYKDISLKEQRELVKEYWIVEKRLDPKYPIEAARKGLSGCVDLIVGINKDGKTSGYKVKESYPKGVFDYHAAASLKSWRWSATEVNVDKTPVLTSIQLDFMVSGAKNAKEAKNKCGWNYKV